MKHMKNRGLIIDNNDRPPVSMIITFYLPILAFILLFQNLQNEPSDKP